MLWHHIAVRFLPMSMNIRRKRTGGKMLTHREVARTVAQRRYCMRLRIDSGGIENVVVNAMGPDGTDTCTHCPPMQPTVLQ